MRVLILGLIFSFILALPYNALSEDICLDCPRWQGSPPYGDYCPGPERGWYGAKKKVKSAKEAKDILMKYFSQYKDLNITNITERRFFFEAEIRDKNENLIDIVIVDKRTGRIRSIY
jgi:hypothetical protein